MPNLSTMETATDSRPASLGSTSSAESLESARSSQKRKSGEGEGAENVPPNVKAATAPGRPADKKLCSKSVSSTGDEVPASSSTKATGIARYQKPAIKTTESIPDKKRAASELSAAAPSESNAAAVAAAAAAASAAAVASAPVTSFGTVLGFDVALKRVQGYISSDVGAGAMPSTPGSNGLLRRSRKAANRTPCADKLKSIFDSTITVSEDKITAILAPVRDASKTTKAKFDFKERCKVMETANKELRDTLVKLVGETKQVREKCLWYESDSESRLREASLQLQEVAQSNAIVKSSEHKLKKELIAANEKIAASEAVCNQLRSDTEKVRDLESRIGDLVAKLSAEQSSCRSQELVISRMEKDFADVKANAAEELRAAKGSYEQHAEQLVNGYKDEITSLRSELSRRQSDAERSSIEKAEIDKKASDLREEIVKIQASLRESEGLAQRQEMETARLTKDLEQTKELLTQKDADWRSTLNSLHEVQRQVAEERGSSRSEISSLQSRASRLEEERLVLTRDIATKTEELGSANREVARLSELVASLEAKVVTKDTELAMLKDVSIQLAAEKDARARSEIREDAERHERIAAVAQLLATQTDCNNRINDIKESFNKTIAGLNEEIATVSRLRDEAASEARKQADIVMGMENEVEQLRNALENASANHESVEKLGRVTGELEILRRRMRETAESKEVEMTATQGRIKDLEDQIKNGEIQRRKLHNVIQELRGNVRVFARVRPFLPSDGFAPATMPDPSILTRSDGQSLRMTKVAKTADDRSEEHSFAFDRVFGPSSSQETVFQEVSEFVQSALDGYNVCLFSYGQTGSGKTHTMQGSGNGSMRGIIPRAMQQVGVYKTELEAKGWDYQMEVSFIEIYNETIRDLLRPNVKDDDKHEIKRDLNGNTTITDVTLTPVDPNDTAQMDAIMDQAARFRSVGQTLMNERSSRSHSVFTLHLRASNAAQGVVLKGALNLVDLAGSERLDRSGATGDRLKETVAINKSLSALTDVFVAIGNKQSHIPFRNSKLTYLLQPALSGDGKTLMVGFIVCFATFQIPLSNLLAPRPTPTLLCACQLVNLSPTDESYFESLCSLRFASQVNQCELGKPKRQMKDAIKDDQVTPAASKSAAAKSASASATAATSASGPARKLARK